LTIVSSTIDSYLSLLTSLSIAPDISGDRKWTRVAARACARGATSEDAHGAASASTKIRRAMLKLLDLDFAAKKHHWLQSPLARRRRPRARRAER